MSPRSSTFILTLLAGSVGGAVALSLSSFAGGGAAPEPPDSADRATGSDQAMSLRDEIIGLRRDLDDIYRPLLQSPDAGVAQRTVVGSDLSGLKTKISGMLRAIEALAHQKGFDAAEVATASLQNPLPNAVAVKALYDAMEQEVDAGKRATHQGWLLTSMAEVVRRLGSPHNILPDAGAGASRQRWEYFVDEKRAVIVTFENGLVTSVGN